MPNKPLTRASKIKQLRIHASTEPQSDLYTIKLDRGKNKRSLGFQQIQLTDLESVPKRPSERYKKTDLPLKVKNKKPDQYYHVVLHDSPASNNRNAQDRAVIAQLKSALASEETKLPIKKRKVNVSSAEDAEDVPVSSTELTQVQNALESASPVPYMEPNFRFLSPLPPSEVHDTFPSPPPLPMNTDSDDEMQYFATLPLPEDSGRSTPLPSFPPMNPPHAPLPPSFSPPSTPPPSEPPSASLFAIPLPPPLPPAPPLLKEPVQNQKPSIEDFEDDAVVPDTDLLTALKSVPLKKTSHTPKPPSERAFLADIKKGLTLKKTPKSSQQPYKAPSEFEQAMMKRFEAIHPDEWFDANEDQAWDDDYVGSGYTFHYQPHYIPVQLPSFFRR